MSNSPRPGQHLTQLEFYYNLVLKQSIEWLMSLGVTIFIHIHKPTYYLDKSLTQPI